MPLIVQLPFGVSADLSFWANVLTWPAWNMFQFIFAIGGWVVLALIFFFMGSMFWADYRGSKSGANWKWVVLAVDIPEELVQSPKAVEQMFSHFSGALESIGVVDKYWKGKGQKWFSLEVVSIEGYIQFLIRCEFEHRDLVEAAVYAQYPAAEITEVEDYVENVPNHFPDDNYDIFGLEFGLAQVESYPIRTYEYFEHMISKDSVFHDPMGSILENFSRIGAGENFWLQIIVMPIDNHWKEAGITLAKGVFSPIESAAKKNPLDFIASLPMKVGQEVMKIWEWNFEPGAESAAAETKRVEITPGTRTVVEAIENKISKIGFKTKVRVLYSAKKPVFNPAKCVSGFVGSMNQFYNTSQNGLVPVAKADLKKPNKANLFIKAFKTRKAKMLTNPYILNVEELATLWHFPLAFVKTPLIQKIASKRAEPPGGLSLESSFNLPVEETETAKSQKAELITDASGQIKTESDYWPDSSTDEAKTSVKTDESKFNKDLPYG